MFLPNLATTLSPLYHLLYQTTVWNWWLKQKKVFKSVKASWSLAKCSLILMTNCEVWCFPTEISVLCRKNSVEGGTELFAPGQEGPCNYFWSQKYHQYLLGRQFEIKTDHQPLTFLFDESRVDGFWLNLEVGSDIWIHIWLLQIQWQCRCTESTSSFSSWMGSFTVRMSYTSWNICQPHFSHLLISKHGQILTQPCLRSDSGCRRDGQRHTQRLVWSFSRKLGNMMWRILFSWGTQRSPWPRM